MNHSNIPSQKKCLLCHDDGVLFYNDERNIFYQCPTCHGIFRSPEQWLPPIDEKSRYETHQYKDEDEGYYNFVSPIIKKVQEHFNSSSIGFDYGCGHQPVLSGYLTNHGFQISYFDPIFYNQTELLTKSYDFIVCCEVMEHFYYPAKEFKMLFERLNPLGKLICKTHMFDGDMKFESWYYKNDPTHVFIYTDKTIHWICENFDIKNVLIEGRLITFSK